ncbi:hypothetical protein HDR60_03885 [bacterium]|nr:hypothetical protein [bacterium]MDE6223915.1 hypothetical protein [Alphaproteobacteria bacterium]
MEEDFKIDDFEFTPPEFDMTSADENVDADTSFTAPSVENTLEEEVSFEPPSFEPLSFEPPSFEFEVIPDGEAEATVEENKDEQSFDNFDEIMPKPEDLMQFEVIPEENIVDTKSEDEQEKIANAIREKMAEMQEEKQELPSFDMTENTEDMIENPEEIPSFEPVKEEANEISPSDESLQTEPVSKDEMFLKGVENLKNSIKNESLKDANLMRNEAEL